jgi:hypothetical protein
MTEKIIIKKSINKENLNFNRKFILLFFQEKIFIRFVQVFLQVVLVGLYVFSLH